MRALNGLDNGITYINAPTIGAEAHLPFGGVKQTGNGHREGGWEVYEFYSGDFKVGYLDFSGSLQRAQNRQLSRHAGLSAGFLQPYGLNHVITTIDGLSSVVGEQFGEL